MLLVSPSMSTIQRQQPTMFLSVLCERNVAKFTDKRSTICIHGEFVIAAEFLSYVVGDPAQGLSRNTKTGKLKKLKKRSPVNQRLLVIFISAF